MYDKAYIILIEQMCIPEPNDILEDGFEFTYYIDLSGESDKIELDYEYTFFKSVFLDKKFKRIRSDVIEYYKMYNIYVSGIYKEADAVYLLLNKK